MYNPSETDEQRRNREAFERTVAAVDRAVKRALPYAAPALAALAAIGILVALSRK